MTPIRDALDSGDTLIFGHRGAMAHAPMNTMASFQAALEQGADGIELDAQLSQDGQIIVLHDRTVDATTDGQGAVADLTLPQLKALDAGAWFDAAFAGETIPTLDEVFAAFGASLLINVEIKCDSAEAAEAAGAVADCIERYACSGRVIVSSFNPLALRRLHAIAPDILIGCLYESAAAEPQPGDFPGEALHPKHVLIDAAYMDRARAQGYYVNTWTVNDPQRALALKRLGVNAIITDDPAAIIAALAP